MHRFFVALVRDTFAIPLGDVQDQVEAIRVAGGQLCPVAIEGRGEGLFTLADPCRSIS